MGPAEAWRAYRAWLHDDAELGIRLDLSRMDLPADLPERMAPAIGRALDAMADLERGAIANPSEGRRVGHYWLRAPELAPEPGIARAIRETRERVVSFASRVRTGELRPERAKRFTHLLLIGIGGSALGPQLLADALDRSRDGLVPAFLDNTDPDGFARVLSQLPLDATLVVVVSKSGGTPETRNGLREAAAAYRARDLGLAAHAVAVTQEESALDREAQQQGFLARFPMWDWVGGRTSLCSAVGLLPGALLGLDVAGLLDGAAAMDRATRRREVLRNPALLLALAWYHAGDGRGTKDMVVLPYRDRLALFGRYLQQLVMESLGKACDLDGRTVHQGLAVYGNKGSTDQHAYVQQLRDGLPNFFVTFIQVLADGEVSGLEVEDGVTSGSYLNGLLLGTRRALHEGGRPSLTVTLADCTPRRVGMLIALYERAVGFYASLIHVNAYDQPGVEAGKRAAAAVLDVERRLLGALAERQGTAEDLAHAIGTDDVETVFLVLESLAANPARGVLRRAGASAADATYSRTARVPRSL